MTHNLTIRYNGVDHLHSWLQFPITGAVQLANTMVVDDTFELWVLDGMCILSGMGNIWTGGCAFNNARKTYVEDVSDDGIFMALYSLNYLEAIWDEYYRYCKSLDIVV